MLGGGPAGLAAGYIPARARRRPVVIEKGKVAGGLTRSIKRGEFIVDVGRKELYNGLAKVDAFWGTLLGDEYRWYPYRARHPFDGHIMESPKFRGFRRSTPWTHARGMCLRTRDASVVTERQQALRAYE